MTDDIKPRPLQGRFPEPEHRHKFFLHSTKRDFLPLPDGKYYIMDEYALLFCNCGESIRRKVKAEE